MVHSSLIGVVSGHEWAVGKLVNICGYVYKIERMYSRDVEDHEMCIYHSSRVTLADLVAA